MTRNRTVPAIFRKRIALLALCLAVCLTQTACRTAGSYDSVKKLTPIEPMHERMWHDVSVTLSDRQKPDLIPELLFSEGTGERGTNPQERFLATVIVAMESSEVFNVVAADRAEYRLEVQVVDISREEWADMPFMDKMQVRLGLKMMTAKTIVQGDLYRVAPQEVLLQDGMEHHGWHGIPERAWIGTSDRFLDLLAMHGRFGKKDQLPAFANATQKSIHKLLQDVSRVLKDPEINPPAVIRPSESSESENP
jgi:hypothetical protein